MRGTAVSRTRLQPGIGTFERDTELTVSIDWRDTGTNPPAVRVNSLLEVAMTKLKHFWNEHGVPTQSLPHAASDTDSA